MDTRVIRYRGVWEIFYDQWRKQRWWVVVLLIMSAGVIGLGWVNFHKEFPPFATISRGPVEAKLMADAKDPARLKKMVQIMTASKVGAWARYRAEKPVVQCIITPIKVGYEASCVFPRDKYVLVKQKWLANEQVVKELLWDLHREATATPTTEPIRPGTRKNLIEA
ncbi:MAG: hypothetical protein WAW00_00620 [Candidatus Moraniibacteriota bacterium]